MKRKLALILVLIISYVGLFADGLQPIGDGSDENPYQISSSENLLWVCTNSNSWSLNFIQTKDIVVQDELQPIGNESVSFTGNYNGQNHKISELLISNATSNCLGLFGKIDSSTIENLCVINVNIYGNSYIGGLAGSVSNSTINNCYSSGDVAGNSQIEDEFDIYKAYYIGGLVGYSDSNTTICRSFSTCSVAGYQSVGGLIGKSLGNVSYSFSSGNVYGNHLYYYVEEYNESQIHLASSIGGFIGNCSGNVTNCYSVCNVTMNGYSDGYSLGEPGYGGGFIGFIDNGNILNCFSSGNIQNGVYIDYDNVTGGLIGYSSNSSVSNSFWDIETSNQSSSSGGTGKTTQQMKSISTYINGNWDFIGESDNGTNDEWNINTDNNNGYPYLIKTIFPNFNIEQEEIISGEQIQFLDNSIGYIDQWEWDFNNDGIIDSYEQNPTWTYTVPGEYSVSLTISAGNYSTSITKENYINVISSATPLFSVEPANLNFGNACINDIATLPITIFNGGEQDLIINNIVSSTNYFAAEFNFSNADLIISPNDSININVSFLPEEIQNYSANLVFFTNDPNNLVYVYYVTGTGYIFTSSFSATPFSGEAPLNVQFTDTSIGDIQNWNWDFGDGTTSTVNSPNHTYEEDGIYTVSLTVTDNYHQRNQTQTDLINVVGHPIIYSNQEIGVDFGTIYLTDSSNDSLIVIQNIGTKDVQINSLELVESNSAFNFTYQNIGIPIRANESDTIFVSFNPQYVGEYSDYLLITNTSENFPNFEINLSGYCDYAPPLEPQNIQIVVVNPNVTISWNAVTENIYGSSINPDGYIIYFSENPGINDDNYFFLVFTPNLNYTHLNVVRFSSQMFYKVVAYVNLSREQIEYFTNLNNSQNRLKMCEIKQSLKLMSELKK